jgi:hypothetical protein
LERSKNIARKSLDCEVGQKSKSDLAPVESRKSSQGVEGLTSGVVLDVTNMVAGLVTLMGANASDYLPTVTPFTAMIA